MSQENDKVVKVIQPQGIETRQDNAVSCSNAAAALAALAAAQSSQAQQSQGTSAKSSN